LPYYLPLLAGEEIYHGAGQSRILEEVFPRCDADGVIDRYLFGEGRRGGGENGDLADCSVDLRLRNDGRQLAVELFFLIIGVDFLLLMQFAEQEQVAVIRPE
jgi:hypothetical protein